MRRSPARLAAATAAVLMFLLGSAAAAPTEAPETGERTILLVTSKRSPTHHDYVNTFARKVRELSARQVEFRTYTPVELTGLISQSGRFPRSDLIVTVGTDAAVTVSGYSDDAPVFFTLIPQSSYYAIVDRFRQNFAPEREHSGLFLDHPVERHLALVSAVLPPVRRVGVLLGSYTSHLRERIREAATRMGLQVVFRSVEHEEQIYTSLQSLLPEVDVLVALPDPAVYNRHTIRNMLITTFRYRKPLFGYSRALVKAGALAALYSEPQAIGDEAARAVARSLAEASVDLPAPRHPSDFSVDVNFWVAESLDLDVPQVAKVLSRVREQVAPE
ncbi:MAG: hypothetical protein GWN84_26940 [Gammaproteobacteria bacterium]|nr:hypothetical protein [Gammaproteobacteria bacterium]